jgi:hypothetical protein
VEVEADPVAEEEAVVMVEKASLFEILDSAVMVAEKVPTH